MKTKVSGHTRGLPKGWRRNRTHSAFPNRKIGWESVNGDTLDIIHVPSSNIPYKIMWNGFKEIDSFNSFERARKSAVYKMRNYDRLEWLRR